MKHWMNEKDEKVVQCSIFTGSVLVQICRMKLRFQNFLLKKKGNPYHISLSIDIVLFISTNYKLSITYVSVFGKC